LKNEIETKVKKFINIYRWFISNKEVDLACSAFTASSDDTTRELAAYISDDGFGILGQYPIPQTSVYGIFMTFSFNVLDKDLIFKLNQKLVFSVLMF